METSQVDRSGRALLTALFLTVLCGLAVGAKAWHERGDFPAAGLVASETRVVRVFRPCLDGATPEDGSTEAAVGEGYTHEGESPTVQVLSI